MNGQKRIVAFGIFLLAFAMKFYAQTEGAEIPEAEESQSVKFSHISLVSFKTNLIFIIGEGSQTYTAQRTLEPFSINRYETTYGLWYQTRVKAEKRGYHFENPGQPGSDGKRNARLADDNITQPVTMISWYDAVVWCNALSELIGRTPCYTYEGKVLKDSSDTAHCDLAECNWNADGFRLPAEAEWEYASRRSKTGFLDCNLVSGQTDSTEPYQLYAWDSENSDGTKVVGTAGTVFSPDTITQPGTGNPNQAGIFDMSGNVLEFCWDWFADYAEGDANKYGPVVGFERVSRGGSWTSYTPFLFCGDRYSYDPNEKYNFMGFRICCSADASEK